MATKKTTTPVAEKAVVVEEVKKVEEAKKAEAPKKAATTKKTATKKAEIKTSIAVQFEGKSYTQEELIQIAKDVWKYDLQKKDADLKSIEIYVKPEENAAYYVMNGEFAGSFYI